MDSFRISIIFMADFFFQFIVWCIEKFLRCWYLFKSELSWAECGAHIKNHRYETCLISPFKLICRRDHEDRHSSRWKGKRARGRGHDDKELSQQTKNKKYGKKSRTKIARKYNSKRQLSGILCTKALCFSLLYFIPDGENRVQ